MQPACQIDVNHTVGDDFDRASFPEERCMPENYQNGDPLRMLPSDFRLWDPYMRACPAPKLYNMPPGTEGRLLQSDIDHLMEIADGLGIRRKTA